MQNNGFGRRQYYSMGDLDRSPLNDSLQHIPEEPDEGVHGAYQ